jgi:hypothetical protein
MTYNSGREIMPVTESVRIHVTLPVNTWERLSEHIVNRYGRGARVISIIADQALNEYLDKSENPQ